MSEFLKTEYEQCLSLIKYYDERQFALVKYSAMITSAVPTLLVAVYKLGEGINAYFWHLVLLSSVASAIATTSIFLGVVQTRLYFVYPVRQVNAIRAYFLKANAIDGFQNQMYLSTTFSAFKLLSTQTLILAFVALEVGLFVSCAIYSAYQIAPGDSRLVVASILVGILLSAAILAIAAYYLHTQSAKTPDESIHREK